MVSKQCGFSDQIHWFCVDGEQICVKKYAVSKVSGFVWMWPKFATPINFHLQLHDPCSLDTSRIHILGNAMRNDPMEYHEQNDSYHTAIVHRTGHTHDAS